LYTTNLPSYYLEELLKPYGKVDTSEKILGEIKEIDVLFTPFPQQTSTLQVLGLLGKFAEYPAILEAFRNPASDDEICDCLQKLLDLRGKLKRRAKAKNTELQDSEIPKLWVLTPTISPPKLSGFNVDKKEGWSSGVYFLGDTLRAAIVAIHQLPRTPETLWLRLLGRGTVQEQAIIELQALPLNHPYQKATLELVYNLRQNLRINQQLDTDDRELVMRLEPLYQQDREQAKLEGRQEERRQIVENLLQVRFGALDDQLSAIIEPVLALPPSEFTPLLMHLSKEELLARFGEQA
jgi:hypothetical protein